MVEKFLSVVIPVYNEEALLLINLPKIAKFLEENTDGYEIVVVDNGSTDKTRELVESTIQDNPKVRLIILLEKSLPRALQAGFTGASYDLAVFYPIDMEPSIQFLGDALETALESNAAMVIGRRYWATTPSASRAKSRFRVFSSLALKILINVILWMPFYDFQSVKLLRLSKVGSYLDQCRTTSLLFECELTYRVAKSGLSVVEVPVEVVPSPRTSRARNLRSLLRVFAELPVLRARLSFRR